MRQFLNVLIVLCGVALGSPMVLGSSYDIKPVGPQDGTIWQNVGTDNLAGAYGLWGFVNGNYYTDAGIHTLPAVNAADVQSAQLIIPAVHGLWTTNGANVLSMVWLVDHFDAIDDNTLTGGFSGHGDFERPSLGTLGLYAGPPWPGQDNSRTVTLDVTTAVKADLLGGLASFAWRILPTQGATQGFNDNAQLFFPLVEAAGFGYPNFGARLVIQTVPEPTAGLILLCGVSMAVLRRRTASCVTVRM